MKKSLLKTISYGLISGFLLFFTIPFQSCNTGKNNTKHDTIVIRDTIVCHDTIIKHDTINKINIKNNNYNNNKIIHKAYKPNIYIYTKKEISLKVNITFPKGGKIIKSIPFYKNGWNIKVDSTGKIDNAFDYLFYESEQPDIWQYKTGWNVEKDSVLVFFQKNLSEYGFNSKEIKDFTDYWVPRFNEFKYYLIYPQEKEIIDNLVLVNYSVKPDNILRLFYVVKGTNNKYKIEKHINKTYVKRKGFYVTEWGVILK